MASYDQYSQRPVFPQSYESEQNTNTSYPSASMATFDFNSMTSHIDMPYYCDQSVMYSDAHLEPQYDMARSPSNTSTMRSYHEVPPLHASGSVGSTSSSTVGSPYSGHVHMMPAQEVYHASETSTFSGPAIVDDGFHTEFVGQFHGDLHFSDHDQKMNGPYVDPVMISSPQETFYHFQTSPVFTQPLPNGLSISQAPSPAPSHGSYHTFTKAVTADNYSQSRPMKRESSTTSSLSGNSPRAYLSGDEENGDNRRCPHPDCGRIFKDLKAHMLTHESVRPERCPIVTCEYHHKGFARKYDRNRHTLTHYKGTMVCGFCPGSGSPAEKSFNRADVFKRHLTTVHQVEQNPPNSRKRSPGSSEKKLSSYCQDATGKCSTCSGTFTNAQDFYEHLDDCVLRVVQREEPSEAINAQRLAEVKMDPALQETLERNHITADELSHDFAEDDDEEEDDEDMEDEDNDDPSYHRSTNKSNKRAIIGGGVSKSCKPNRRGMTWSRGGVALVAKGRKRRKNYPPSWGMSAEKVKMKKRVLCVYDGPRRLLKDDMMLNNEFEVRMKLADGQNYVTDLDVGTLKRAQAYHNATPDEKGPWMPEQDFLNNFMN